MQPYKWPDLTETLGKDEPPGGWFHHPAHVPEPQHHKQSSGSFFKALSLGVVYYSVIDYQDTRIWEQGKR